MNVNSQRVQQHAPILQQPTANCSQSPTEYQEKSVEQFMDDTTTTPPPQEVAHDDTHEQKLKRDIAEFNKQWREELASKYAPKPKKTPVQDNVKDIGNLLKPHISETINVDTRYVGKVMKAVILKNNRVLVASDMGTGKTYGMAATLQDAIPHGVVLIVTHLTSLVQGNRDKITDLLDGVSARIAHYSTDAEVDIADAQIIFTTLHSLGAVINKIGGADQVSLTMFDESESVSQIMTAEIMDKNRESVSNALDSLSESGCKVVMLDAHLAASTHAFCNAFFGGDWAHIQNRYKRWLGTTYTWIKDADTRNAEKAGIAKIAQMLRDGKKLFVTTGSKKQAVRIYNTLKKLGLLDGLRVLQGWGESPELTDCKDNHDLFNDYPLVIGTPAIGTGISIEPRDGEPNFDSVVSFIVRHQYSPDAVSSMQMPFRVRATRENKIWLVECDFAPDDNGVDWGVAKWGANRDTKRQIELISQLNDHYSDAIADPAIRKLIFSTYAGFSAAIALHKSAMWAEFWDLINAEFERKGMTRAPDLYDIDGASVADADKAARVEAKEDAIFSVFEAIDIRDDQAAAIEVKARYGNATSPADKLSLEKYKLVSNYAPDDCDTSDLQQFKKLLTLKNRGYMAGVMRMANAQLPLTDINKIVRAWTVDGLRQKDATSMDAVRIKIEWRLDRILCDVAGVARDDDGVYKVKTLVVPKDLTGKGDGRTVNQRISDILDDWNATHVDNRLNRNRLTDDALTFVGKLLVNRLKLNARVKDGGFIDIAKKQPAIDLLNLHAKRGAMGLAKLVEKIDLEPVDPVTVDPKIIDDVPENAERDATSILKQAWSDAGKPCRFDDVLSMFLPYRADIEDENGYSIEALVMGIRANFRAAA